MLHPLFRLALARPDLLADHAGAYAELAVVSAREALAEWQLRVVGWALMAAGLLLCVAFTGVALMLHGAVASPPMPWLLWAVPLAPALLALLGAALAHRRVTNGRVSLVTQQFESDLALLKAST